MINATEQKKLKAALFILEKSKEPIVRPILEVIKNGQVDFYAYRDITKSDWKKFISYLSDTNDNVLSGKFPLTIEDIKALNKSFSGYQLGKRIYLSFDHSAEKLALTIVHEITHYLQGISPYFGGTENTFLNESNAFYAEQLFKGKKSSRSLLFFVGEKVNRNYKLNEDPARLSLAATNMDIPKLELKKI